MPSSIADLHARGHQLKAALDAPAATAASLRRDAEETAQALAALSLESAAVILGHSAAAKLDQVVQLLEQAQAALDAFVQACEQARDSGGARPPREPYSTATATRSASHARLANSEQADIDYRKFTAYSMAPENPNNDGKWRAWQQLGYDLTNRREEAAADVMRQLRAQLPHTPTSGRIETNYGPRHSVRTTVTGPNGRTGTLVSVWQYDDGSDEPRMVTHWLEVHTGKGKR